MRWLLLITLLWAIGCTSSDAPRFSYAPETMSKEVVKYFPSGDTMLVKVFSVKSGSKLLYGSQEYYPTGGIKVQGMLSPDGKRIGVWESFYEDGKKWSIGTYDQHGVQNGLKQVWYDNGKLRYQGQMKDDKRFGTWEYFNRKGEKIKEKE